MLRRAACLPLLALLLVAGPTGGAERGRTEAELKAITRQIEKVRQEVRRTTLQRDRLSRDLAEAEGTVTQARTELERLRQERGEREKARAQLAAEKREREGQLGREREALAAQLRAAYQTGPREPLRLLLNQRDPGTVGRTFAYYGYFGRARAAQVDAIKDQIAKIEEDDARIAAEDAELARLEEARKARLDDLEQARRQRSKVLAELTAEARDRQKNLRRLQSQQAALEKLLKDLDKALRDFPVDANDAFAKLRGRLAWPVPGKLSARFGEVRAGGVRWNGLVIATPRGTPVRAVYQGRVAYADTLPGLGLLVIVDHGNGYLSLYGHNDRLYQAAGAQVKAGDVIAAAGDSGGRAQPELYFEIRRSGKPVDPAPWFKTPRPPAD